MEPAVAVPLVLGVAVRQVGQRFPDVQVRYADSYVGKVHQHLSQSAGSGTDGPRGSRPLVGGVTDLELAAATSLPGRRNASFADLWEFA